jgi:hypothetical protein
MEIPEKVEHQDDGKGNSHQPQDQSTAHENVSSSSTSAWKRGAKALVPDGNLPAVISARHRARGAV